MEIKLFSLGLLIIVFFLSWFLTKELRLYALNTGMLDMPNHRSSHHIPTPKGGGISFVLSFLITIPLLWLKGIISTNQALPFLIPGAFIAFLGFIDDRVEVSARLRLLCHFAASFLALYYLGGMPALSCFHWFIPAGIFLNCLMAVYLVWLLNLYNFMDGIDGLASIQTFSVCLGGALLYFISDKQLDGLLPLILASAVIGFLYWNFPKALIFMGDVGSGFLGFTVGIMSLQSALINQQLFFSWLILSAVFIVDSTITLIRRGIAGKAIFKAHRSHAYQHAASQLGQHQPVTLAVFAINMCYLLPLSLLCTLEFLSIEWSIFLSYFPIILLVIKFKAGKDNCMMHSVLDKTQVNAANEST